MNTIFTCELELEMLDEKVIESKSFDETIAADNVESVLAQCEHKVKLIEIYLKRKGLRYRKEITHRYFDDIDSKACGFKEFIEVRFINPMYYPLLIK